MPTRSKTNSFLRERLFEEGATALARVRPDLGGLLYGCPLCLKGYPREALDAKFLTLEHAPPQGMSGRSVKVLACHPCNSGAGTQLDHEMLAMEYAFDIGNGTLPPSARLRLEVGGRATKVEVLDSKATGDGFELAVLLKERSPKTSIANELERMAESQDPTLDTVSIVGRFNERKAARGWVRSAYLVAFALFGYGYVLRPDLRSVHQEILTNDDASARYPIGIVPNAERASRRILVIDEPSSLRGCLAIHLGRHVVVLPGTSFEDRFLEKFSPKPPQAPDLQLFGTQEWPWPSRPQFMLGS